VLQIPTVNIKRVSAEERIRMAAQKSADVVVAMCLSPLVLSLIVYSDRSIDTRLL